MEMAAKWGHGIVYAFLILVPLGGSLAWYGGIEGVGDGHEIFANVFMIVVLGHAGIAIVHQVLWKDGTLTRMLKPQG